MIKAARGTNRECKEKFNTYFFYRKKLGKMRRKPAAGLSPHTLIEGQ